MLNFVHESIFNFPPDVQLRKRQNGKSAQKGAHWSAWMNGNKLSVEEKTKKTENKNGQEMLLELIVYVPDRKLL